MFSLNSSAKDANSANRWQKEEDDAAIKIQQIWRSRKTTGTTRHSLGGGRISSKTTYSDFKERRKRSQTIFEQAASKWENIRHRSFFPEPKHTACQHSYRKLTMRLSSVSKTELDLESIPNMKRFKMAVYLIMEEPSSCIAAELMSLMVLGTVVLSIICFALETIPELGHIDVSVWFAVEVFCSITFSLEYGIRFWACTADGTTRSKFVVGTMNMLDLAAILPFYIQMAFLLTKAPASGLLRVFRVFRIFRILKLSRYSKGMQMMSEAVMSSMHILMMLFFVLVVGIIIFASMVYFLEKLSCPQLATLSENDKNVYDAECGDSFNGGKSPSFGLCCDEWESPWGYPSVPAGFWWSIVTMTTVGFGDMYPMTWQGRFVGIFAMLVGILLIALPTAIVGRKFQEVYEREEELKNLTEAQANGRWTPNVASLAPPQMADGPKAPGEDGTRLRSLKIKNPQLAQTMTELADLFEETDQFYGKMQQSCIDQVKTDEKINICFRRVVQFMEDDLQKGTRSTFGPAQTSLVSACPGGTRLAVVQDI